MIGCILANVFYEPSTRTSCSFQAAMLRLGGSVISVAESTSSAKKGETLSDTVKSLACYCDVIVLRHPRSGAAAEAAAALEGTGKAVLNAGDGVGEHPTQALLDLYTLVREFGGTGTAVLKGKTVVLLGDLLNGRTVHSLAKLLSSFEVNLVYVAPAGLEMPESIVEAVAAKGVATQRTAASLGDVVASADALYVTRVQRERFSSETAYEASKGSYVVDADLMQAASPKCVVLHPLPRVDEISTDFDSDPRAACFRQMENGMFVRMALLALVLGAL
jgi:aspartate carbamoyltransferase